MPPTPQDQVNAFLRKISDRLDAIEGQHRQVLDKYEEFIRACEEAPQSITKEIDAIPGRRIFYNLAGRQNFTSAQNGLRAAPIPFLISQDGGFIATHYPMVMWKPNAPASATNFGFWSPVGSWPLPTQQQPTQDRIDLSYEVVDAGAQRNFQNEASPPVFSRPDNFVPLPVPTMLTPNSVTQFFPTYERIFFDSSAAIPTTGGQLAVVFPGYRIVNM